MFKTLLYSTLFLVSLVLNAQSDPTNLDFEEHTNGEFTNWSSFGDGVHTISVDKANARNGSAALIASKGDNGSGFKALNYSIPVNFGGKKVTITGYIKTENVTGGWAGLWLRIDPNLGFNNMRRKGITGTTDWKKYSITLDLDSSQAEDIVFGGLLVGSGKMWLDDLKITVDGKPISEAPEKVLSAAQKDTEFNSGSGITVDNLTDQKIKNLDILARVWGFLKYHHPKVATGNYNWDYELFRIITPVMNAGNDADRDELLVDWINYYYEIPPCSNCKKTAEDAVIKPDHKWIKDGELSDELRDKLIYVYENRFIGNNYYVEYANLSVRNPKFKNEMSYKQFDYPDAGFRLLTLFRYWNMIQYYFPYKDVTDKDWNDVLSEYIPHFVNSKDELEYEIATLQLIREIGDTHASLRGGNKISEWRGVNYPPVHLSFVEDKLVVVDYYNPEMKQEIGLEIGDIIKSVNGVPIEDYVKKNLPYYTGSNETAQKLAMSRNVLRSNNTSVSITYERDGKSASMEIPLFNRNDLNYYYNYKVNKDEPAYKFIKDNIGYVTLANIKDLKEPSQFMKEFENTDGLIIDIRNYPSKFVVFALGSQLVPKGVDFVKFTVMNPENPGEFTFTQPLSNGKKKAEKVYQGKVVILVNEFSISQSEYTAMAFRAAPGAVVIGGKTSGADGNVSSFTLPAGLSTAISGIGIYYPDGSPTQRIGIVPDIPMEPTIAGIKAGKDELLEKAIEVIEQSRD